MKLTVIIPTYNEAPTLSQIIEKVKSVPINKEIIIIDDGSTDKTNNILKKYIFDKQILVLNHRKNMGKGSAISTAQKFVTGDIVIIQDADLETNPQNYLQLIKPILNLQGKVVYGSRFLNNKKNNDWKFYYGAKLLTKLTNLLYNQNLTDAHTCYKMFDSKLFKSLPLKCKGFEFCPEVTARISKMGIKIIELPMEYYPRTTNGGKKLKIKDGVIALITLFRYKLLNCNSTNEKIPYKEAYLKEHIILKHLNHLSEK